MVLNYKERRSIACFTDDPRKSLIRKLFNVKRQEGIGKISTIEICKKTEWLSTKCIFNIQIYVNVDLSCLRIALFTKHP